MLSRILALALAFTLSGCTLKLHDKVEKEPVRIGLGCLSDAATVLTNYANGSLPEAQLEGFFNCSEKALDTFYAHTEGGDPDSYRASELSWFLKKYFLKEKEIPPSLMAEIMVLKQSVFGGSSERLTKKELIEIREVLKVTRRVAKRLRPYMPIQYDTFVERNYSREEFEKAMTEFQEGFAELTGALQRNQGAYSLKHHAALLSELKAYLYGNKENESGWITNLMRWSVILQPAKALFIASPSEDILPEDWKLIYKFAPQYYTLYMRGRFYTHGVHTYLYGRGLRSLETFFDDSLRLLGEVINLHPEKEISSAEINNFLDAMQKADVLPVPADTVESFLKIMFSKWLGARTADQSYSVNNETFVQMARTFRFATEGLRAIEQIYRSNNADDPSFKKRMNRKEFARAAADRMKQADQNEISLLALNSLEETAKIAVVFPGDWDHVAITAKRQTLSLQHMAKLHLFRSINRVAFSAYAKSRGENKTVLTAAEVGNLADDLFPLLKHLGMVTDDTRDSIPQRLTEASFFLPSSDGYTSLTMNEALEFEALIFSTFSYGGTVHKKMIDICGALPDPLAAKKEKEEKNPTLIPASCYRKEFKKAFGDIWAYVPGLANYVERLPSREQDALFGRLESFLRKKQKSDKPFAPKDTQSFIMLPYYVELLFSRFDKNQNGKLENSEAELAYSVFQPFLSKKASEKGLTDPEDHHALYMYLLAYRSLPEGWDDKLNFWWRRHFAGDKDFQADRGQVIEIFDKILSL